MVSMTKHDERLTRVQQGLWYLTNNEDARKVLRAMIKKMKKVEGSFERIKKWRQEVKFYIPDDPKHDENYWIAAYIIYTNMEKFKDMFDELDNIKQELGKLEDELNELRHKEEKLEERIENLRDELPSLRRNKEDKVVENLLREIDNCEKDLEDVEVTYGEKLRRLSRLEGKRYHHLLPEIIKLAKQLVAS